MKKKVIAALVAAVAIIVAMFIFLPAKIVCAILFGAVLIAAVFGITFAAAKSWEDLEKKDPKKARELWGHVLQEFERSRYLL
jgi:ABC-type transport system involved in cytochrome bd biosynthesis fused ATPase/permease subunit